MKYRLLTDRGILRRPTNVLLDSVDGNTNATLTLDLSMPDPAYLLIEADDGGTGYISGVVDGVTTTEQVSIPGDGIARTENEFSSVVGMTFSDISGEISIRAVERSGQPKMFYENVSEFVPCRIFDKSMSHSPSPRGETDQDAFAIYIDYDPDFSVYMRDVLYVYDPNTPAVEGMTFQLDSVLVQRGHRRRPSFYSAWGRRL